MLTADELSRIPLFSSLEAKELGYLSQSVEDIRLVPGEYLVHEGDLRGLFITVEGKLEVTKVVDGVERVIGIRAPGALFGETPMVLNTPFPASLRASESSRVIKVSVKVFHTLAAAAPQISAKLGAAALERIEGLKKIAAQPPRPELLVIGPRWDAAVHSLQVFLHQNQIPFDWLTPQDPALAARTIGLEVKSGPYPIVQLPDGARLVAPSPREIARAVGLSVSPREADYDLIIVGGGPAGLTAAVNAASEGLRTVLIERFSPGGQAGASSRIENYLGFPFGVSGDDLASRALQQAKRLGAEIVVTRRVEQINCAAVTVTLDGGEMLQAKAIVLALGVEWRRLGNESVERLVGRGVYYGAARSDASLAQGRDVYLVGAGNSAGQAAVFFANHATSVTLLVRGESLGPSMSRYLTDQIATKSNVRVETGSEIVAVHGDEHLEQIEIADRRAATVVRKDAAVLFVLIGADASTDWLPAEIARDSHGFILTGADAGKSGRWNGDRLPHLLETSAPGIFAVGDVRAGSVKRVAAGVGEGGMAITFVHRHLQSLAKSELPQL
jgi:thioredoxin reductase (NADPH)